VKKQSVEVAKLTAKAFAAEVKRTGQAVLPVGSVEIHGSHAPLGLDTYVAKHIAVQLAKAADALVFPPIWYATCSVGYEAKHWPGTLSPDFESELAYIAAIATEIARQGVEKLVFINGHGPNGHLLELAAYKIWSKTGMAMGVLEWWSAARETVREIKGFAYGNHADEIETSIFLATPQGDLADLKAATVNPPGPQVGAEELELYLSHMRYTHTFDARWLGESGNFGDPARATKEKGDAIVAATVQIGKKMFAALTPYVDRAKLMKLREGSLA
jgi:creatinine amidohydrolase